MNSAEVSIIVLSYNSSKTILETLKSIEKQTFKMFEVIIADDNSEDSTLELAYNWKEENKNKIKNIMVIKTIKNYGITKNINNALKYSKGKWIKIIAADDILDEKCLEKNIEFVKIDTKRRVCVSKAKTFGKYEKTRIIPKLEEIKIYEKSQKEQIEYLLGDNFIVAPTSFIKKEIFEEYGDFDERIPMLEDRPYWIKLLTYGEKIYFLNEVTVYYRVGESLSNTKRKIVNLNFYSSKKLLYKYYIKNKAGILLNWHYASEFLLLDILIKVFNNKNNKFITIILKLKKIFDPYIIIKKIKYKIYSQENKK